MKYSIRTQVLAVIIFTIVLSFGIQTAFNLFFAQDYYTDIKSNTVENAFYEISQAYDGTIESVEGLLQEYQLSESLNIVFFDDQSWIYPDINIEGSEMDNEIAGRLLQGFRLPPGMFERENFSTSPVVRVASSNPTHFGSGGNSENTTLLLQGSFDHEGQPVYLTITMPLPAIERSVQTLTTPSIIISAAVLVLGIVLAALLSKSLANPLRQMERIASSLATLDFSELANENISCSELSRLSRSINTMSTQLKQAIFDLNIANAKLKQDIDKQKQLEQAQRSFIAAVSHEMKTPLTLLELYASNIRDNPGDIDRDYYCSVLIEESRRLSDMVGSMLNLSLIERKLENTDFSVFDLSEHCTNFINKMMPTVGRHDFSFDIEPEIFVHGDSDSLEQAMRNFLNNAIEHTPDKEKISVSLKTIGSQAVFSVFNSGSHISEEDIPHLWESFYRADKARGRANGNIGLGLHLVKSVITAHGGAVGAENKENGVQFSFCLPKETA